MSAPGTLAEVTGRPLLNGLREAWVPDDRWELLAACPLCGGSESVLDVAIVEGRRPGPITAVCTACEYGFLRRRPMEAWFAQYYAQDWDASGQAHAPVKARPDRHVAAFCAPHLGAGAAVLDAGAGFGRALLGFRERGFVVHGLEPSAHRALFVRDVLGIPCEAATAEEAAPGRRFDLVVLQHVLEHVRDPVAALRALRRHLEPEGLLYVAVPSFWAEPAPQNFHYVGHCSLFTETALRHVMAAAGLRVTVLDSADQLQALATPDEDSGAGPSPTGRFEADVAAWAATGFGPGPTRRSVAWFKHRSRKKDPYLGYRVEQVPGRYSSGLIRAAHRTRRPASRWAVPAARALQRAARTDVSRKAFRMLPVQVTGEGLPVTVRHAVAAPPVWVK